MNKIERIHSRNFPLAIINPSLALHRHSSPRSFPTLHLLMWWTFFWIK